VVESYLKYNSSDTFRAGCTGICL